MIRDILKKKRTQVQSPENNTPVKLNFYGGVANTRQETLRKSPYNAHNIDYLKNDDDRTARNSIYNSMDGEQDIYIYDELPS